MLQTQLEMVNILLGVIEESPVNSVDSSHPDVYLALSIWNEQSTTIQSYGWWYNMEEYELTIDGTDSMVYLPDGTIAIDDASYIARGRVLYDLENHTKEFTSLTDDELTLTCLMEWDLDELPPVMYSYILAQCKVQMLLERDYNANKLSGLQAVADKAWVFLQKQNLRFQDPNRTQTNSAYNLLRNQTVRRY